MQNCFGSLELVWLCVSNCGILQLVSPQDFGLEFDCSCSGQLHQKKQDYTAKGLAEQEQKIKEDSGNLLMNKYMAFLLSTKDNFMQTATCYSCGRRTDATSPPKKRAKKVVGEEE